MRINQRPVWNKVNITDYLYVNLFNKPYILVNKTNVHFLFNNLMSVFHASVLLLIMNFVITLSK